jgi:uncharacterized membrane protein
MNWDIVHTVLVNIQHFISLIGIAIIFFGVLMAAFHFVRHAITKKLEHEGHNINKIRLNLGRVLILGLEFIVAADLIGSTTTPDYYEVGILAIIVLVRTVLSFSINRELMSLSKEK